MKWLVVALALGTTGCAGTHQLAPGTESNESIAAKLILGKTTKEQVIAWYGGPRSTSPTPDGGERWTYALNFSDAPPPRYFPYYQVIALPDHGVPRTLTVVFDKTAHLANYSVSDAAGTPVPAPPH